MSDSESLTATQLTHGLPQRFFFDVGADVQLDKYGLLPDAFAESACQEGRAIRLADMFALSDRCALILGPGYAGKSFTLNRLKKFVRIAGSSRQVLHTDIRTYTAYSGSILPDGWIEWRNSGGNATWFIDSLDEGGDTPRVPLAVLQVIDELDDSQRARLWLVISCRENQIPHEFQARMQSVLGAPCRLLRICAPSHSEASELCGGESTFARVLAVLVEHDLRSLAEHPAVLIWLSRRADATVSSRADVWRGVIDELLDGAVAGNSARLSPLPVRFKAAVRLAFIQEFAEVEGFTFSGPSPDRTAPHLDSVFEPHELDLRNAAREVVLTPLFRASGGTFRVQSRHLREWLAARQLCEFATKDRWEQIRELLGDAESMHWSGATVAGLLEEILPPDAPDDLRAWLHQQHEGFARLLFTGLLEAVASSPVPVDTPTHIDILLRRLAPEAMDNTLKRLTGAWAGLSDVAIQFVYAVAEKLGTRTLREVAWLDLCNETRAERVRIDALRYLSRVESLDVRGLLATLGMPRTKANEGVRTELLWMGLKSGVFTASEALGAAPVPERGLGDMRWLLVHEIGERLDLDAAFTILERPSLETRDYLAEKAVEFLMATPELLSLDRFVTAVQDAIARDDWSAQKNYERVIQSRVELRRGAYERFTSLGTDSDISYVFRTLRVEDLSWLLSKLDAAPWSERMVVDAYQLSQNSADHHVRVELLRKMAPDVVARIEQERAKYERRIARNRKPEEPKITQEAALRQVLANESVGASRQLQNLGWVGFSDSRFRPPDVVGSAIDLPVELQAEVFQRLKVLLVLVSPSDIPEGNAIPWAVIAESAAVEAAVAHYGARSFDADVLVKWLPTLLRGLDNDDVLLSIVGSIPRQAVDSYFEFIRRDVSSLQRGAYTAHRSPDILWASGLRERVEDLLLASGCPVSGRAALLYELRRREPMSASQVARKWLCADSEPALVSAAVRVLAWTSPEDAVAALSIEVDKRGQDALLDVVGEFDRWGGDRGVSLGGWDEVPLEGLARLLFACFPESGDPNHRGVHSVSPVDEAIGVRQRCVSELINRWVRGSTYAQDVLFSLAVDSPRLRETLAWHVARMKADLVLRDGEVSSELGHAVDGLPPNPVGVASSRATRARTRLGLAQILAVLRSHAFRVPRTQAEVLRVVCEVLKEIAADLVDDLSLFFPNGFEKRHGSEDALQTYVRRRLNDLMPGKVVDRESWMPLNKKVDLKVGFLPPGSASSIEVPLEIKWSDDPRTPVAASGQLGELYMVNSARSHGIYLVVWTGVPKRLGKSGLRNVIARDIEGFQTARPGFHIQLVWWSVVPGDL